MPKPHPHASARAVWLKVHLWLALCGGVFFVLMGLSGSVLVYGEALDELLNPALTVAHPGREPLSLDRLLRAVKAAHPDRPAPWTLELPRHPHGLVTAWYERPRETRDEFHAPLMVSIDPYTGEIVASRFWGETAMTWLFRLHAELHLGRFGWNFAGLLGLAFTASIISGLYLWWPGVAGLRRAFSVRHDLGLRRFAVDLHRVLGWFSAPLLLLFALSGFHLVYSGLLERVLGAASMGHGEDLRTVRSTAQQNDRPVGMAEAVLVARGLFAHGEVRRVTEPDGAAGTFRVELRQREETYSRHPATWVWVDRWSGQIREVQNPKGFAPGERFLSGIWPWHTGEALGPFGRFLWFLLGLMPLVFYLTGLTNWLIGRGVVGDRAVDFTALRQALQKARWHTALAWRFAYRHLAPPLRRAWACWRRSVGDG